MSNFLFEIGCEEIPARMIDNASAELSRRVRELLIHERLADAVSLQEFSTPRRLAVIVSGVSQAQPDIEEQVMGPSLKVAYPPLLQLRSPGKSAWISRNSKR